MTVSRVSARDPYPVSSMTKGIQDKLGAHTSCAGDADDPDIRLIRHTAHACEVGSTITAPVAKKGYNLGLPSFHTLSLPTRPLPPQS